MKNISFNSGGTFIPSSYNTSLSSGISSPTSNPTSNGLTNTGSTTYAILSGSTNNASGYAYYDFDVSEIPSNANITSVSCIVRGRASVTGTTSGTGVYQLCNGTTPKGSGTPVTTTTTTNFTLNAGSWTRDELSNAKLKITVYRHTRGTRYYYANRLYGAQRGCKIRRL